MKVTITKDLKLYTISSGLSALACPSCGENSLHHSGVQAFSRDEDAKTGRRVTVLDEKIEVTTDLEGNPSPRRGGIRIGFWCEMCYAIPTLAIYQHKGCTFIQWEEKDDVDEEFEDVITCLSLSRPTGKRRSRI